MIDTCSNVVYDSEVSLRMDHEGRDSETTLLVPQIPPWFEPQGSESLDVDIDPAPNVFYLTAEHFIAPVSGHP